MEARKEKEQKETELAVQLSFSDLRFGEELGAGGSAVVFFGTYKEAAVAIKYFDRPLDPKVTEYLPNITNITSYAINETKLTALFASPFTVQTLGYAIDTETEKPCIVLEYMKKGELHEVLRKSQLTVVQRVQIAHQVAQALLVIHSKEYVYVDIKSCNVLLDEQLNAKLADFDIAREEGSLGGGTPGYFSPEVVNGKGVTKKSDVYSFGVLFLEIICLDVDKFDEAIMGGDEFTNEQVVRATRQQKIHNDLHKLINQIKDSAGNRYCFHDKTSALSMISIIERCLQWESGKRLTMGEVVEAFRKLYFSVAPKPSQATIDAHRALNQFASSSATAAAATPMPSQVSVKEESTVQLCCV